MDHHYFSRWLQTAQSAGMQAPRSSDDELDESFKDMVMDRFFWFAIVLLLLLFCACVGFSSLRRYLRDKYGWCACCVSQRARQEAQDRELAAELQRQLADEEREEQALANRQVRHEWYTTFLRPYSMVRV